MIDSIIETLEQRFTSSNSVPVERAQIKASEWHEISQQLEQSEKEKKVFQEGLIQSKAREGWHERQKWKAEDELEQAKLRLAELEKYVPRWYEGEPPKVYRSKWFIAETTHGDRVVLKELPEENSYDYTTKDGTYMKAWLLKRWMQFHDSEFIPPDKPCNQPET